MDTMVTTTSNFVIKSLTHTLIGYWEVKVHLFWGETGISISTSLPVQSSIDALGTYHCISLFLVWGINWLLP